jgi:hypothetical protein
MLAIQDLPSFKLQGVVRALCGQSLGLTGIAPILSSAADSRIWTVFASKLVSPEGVRLRHTPHSSRVPLK